MAVALHRDVRKGFLDLPEIAARQFDPAPIFSSRHPTEFVKVDVALSRKSGCHLTSAQVRGRFLRDEAAYRGQYAFFDVVAAPQSCASDLGLPIDSRDLMLLALDMVRTGRHTLAPPRTYICAWYRSLYLNARRWYRTR